MASDKVEKKRKRASNGHERPTKKPALDLQSLPPLKANLIKDHSELTPVLSTQSAKYTFSARPNRCLE
jgi:DNA-directed RNA polymerase I subunit RPA49